MVFQFLTFVIPLLSTLVALGLAALVLLWNRKAWTNRWLALGLSTIGVHQAILLASSLAEQLEWRLILFRLALAVFAAIPLSWLVFLFSFGEMNGGSRLGRWRLPLIGAAATFPLAWFGLATGHVVQAVRLEAARSILVGLDAWGKLYFSAYLVGLSLVLLLLENLYRSADRLTRWKIKFLVLGVYAAFACQIVLVSYALLYGVIHPLHPLLGALAFLLGETMIAFSLIRHRLLDVDIFVSRYIVYRSLTLALVGGYLLFLGVAVEVFQRLNVSLDLLSGTVLAILGAVALSLLLLSDDLRRRVQRFLHTHFYKHKYDYRVEWMEYTRQVLRATSAPEIASQTVTRILEVMWVHQVAMYTVGEAPGEMTLAHAVNYECLPSTLELPPATLKALLECAKTIPLTPGQDDPSYPMPTVMGHVFPEATVGCLVPVVALDTLVGLLVVGPEVSGKPFGVDDRDLLVAMAAQAGALLLNARLSQEALEAHELQALARLSAFIAHDLKNMVSMLSMLVENAKLHMAKPEFQADAIRTLGDITARMRRLLAAMTSPNGRAEGHAKAVGLASIIEAAMQEIHAQAPSRIRLETRLGWTPDIRVDPEQFRSVFQNLVLNGIEAIPTEGSLVIETFQENGQAVLAITDTGRGMTREFIQRRLFRPFQTTKARGLGIGLYQCRHMIQSFGGTLTAESQEGKGTRMIVRLPCETVSVQCPALSHS